LPPLLLFVPDRLSEHVYDSDAEGDAAGGASDDATGAGAAGRAADEAGERSGGAGRGTAALDPETVFMQVRGCCVNVNAALGVLPWCHYLCV
jgi:hypothetical protein